MWTALAKRDDARFANAIGIIEDVFESQHIRSVCVLVNIHGVNQGKVFATGIGNQAYVTFVSESSIGRIVPTSSSYAQRMRTMRLVNAIERVSQSEQLILAYVIASHVKITLQRIRRDMVPHTFNTVVCG